jgi:hypothetical protein
MTIIKWAMDKKTSTFAARIDRVNTYSSPIALLLDHVDSTVWKVYALPWKSFCNNMPYTGASCHRQEVNCYTA